MTPEQERAVEALALRGRGFASAEPVLHVKDGRRGRWLVRADGEIEDLALPNRTRQSLREFEREVYGKAATP